MRSCSSSRPTSMSIRQPRSPAWSECSSRSSCRAPCESTRTNRDVLTEETAMASAYDRHLLLAITMCSLAACASRPRPYGTPTPAIDMSTTAPNPDPRVGLRAGLMNAGEAAWNLRVLSQTPPSEKFAGVTNSDLAFTGHYVIQGNYNGYQVWDITDPSRPVLKTAYLCPASQSDVSVYKNLLFVSGEGLG